MECDAVKRIYKEISCRIFQWFWLVEQIKNSEQASDTVGDIGGVKFDACIEGDTKGSANDKTLGSTRVQPVQTEVR